MDADTRTRRVAHHEAGHVVALLALGGDFDSVSITGDRRALGHVHKPRVSHSAALGRKTLPAETDCSDESAQTTDETHLLTNAEGIIAVALLAGSHAERHALGAWDRRAAAHDRREARRLLARRVAPTSAHSLPSLAAALPTTAPPDTTPPNASADPEVEQDLLLGERIAERLIRDRWAVVEHLTQALLEQGCLSGAECRRLEARILGAIAPAE